MAVITNPQIRMIYALCKTCGLDDETLHMKAHALTGKDSLKALTSQEAARLIDTLKRECGQVKEPTIIEDRATEAQRRMIYALVRALGWIDNPKRLRGFLESKFHVSDVAFIPREKVSGVIEALKAMKARGYGERIEKTDKQKGGTAK